MSQTLCSSPVVVVASLIVVLAIWLIALQLKKVMMDRETLALVEMRSRMDAWIESQREVELEDLMSEKPKRKEKRG